MAHGPRELMKRKTNQIITHVEKAQQGIMELGEFYAVDHPEVIDQLKTIYAFYEQAKELIRSFRGEY